MVQELHNLVAKKEDKYQKIQLMLQGIGCKGPVQSPAKLEAAQTLLEAKSQACQKIFQATGGYC